MNIGMLWYDNDKKKTIEKKVQDAADYYAEKYGLVADVCFVHPSMIKENTQIGNIELQQNNHVTKNYFWVGRKNESKSQD